MLKNCSEYKPYYRDCAVKFNHSSHIMNHVIHLRNVHNESRSRSKKFCLIPDQKQAKNDVTF